MVHEHEIDIFEEGEQEIGFFSILMIAEAILGVLNPLFHFRWQNNEKAAQGHRSPRSGQRA